MKRQNTFHRNGVEPAYYKVCRNAVMRERKAFKVKFYQSKVEPMNKSDARV